MGAGPLHGLVAFSGITIGLGGTIVGIHWSLALSAAVLLAITVLLWARMRPSGRDGRE